MKHFFTKTVGGAALATFGYLSQPEVFAVLPKKAAAVITGIGAILSIWGGRSAIAKNGTGQ